MPPKTKILILGATGMLGHVLFKKFFYNEKYEVSGTVRNLAGLKRYFPGEEAASLIPNVDVENFESVSNTFRAIRPDIVINCIGIIKHLPLAKNHLVSISINALLPHQLANLCENTNARLIHLSTDCVFNGKKGDYTESDISDAEDLYGKTKFLGEVDYPHAVTLRTSIIGHELQSSVALVDWFLNQEERVRGYTKAIYTGLTTYELADVILNHVIPNEELHGLYQVASEKITKYELLKLINQQYNKTVEVEAFAEFVLDRSLRADRFRSATGYTAPAWPDMVRDMHKYFLEWDYYRAKFSNK